MLVFFAAVKPVELIGENPINRFILIGYSWKKKFLIVCRPNLLRFYFLFLTHMLFANDPTKTKRTLVACLIIGQVEYPPKSATGQLRGNCATKWSQKGKSSSFFLFCDRHIENQPETKTNDQRIPRWMPLAIRTHGILSHFQFSSLASKLLLISPLSWFGHVKMSAYLTFTWSTFPPFASIWSFYEEMPAKTVIIIIKCNNI